MANNVAYGFVGIKHLFNSRVKDVGQGVLENAINESLQEQERQVNVLMSAWAEPTTLREELVYLPTSATLQEFDEFGTPLPRRDGLPYEVGYPLQFAGDAWGLNRLTRLKMTLAEANRRMVSTLDADAKWVRKKMLQAVFTNTNLTFNDDRNTAVTVTPLANNDGTGYTIEGSEDVDKTHTHYLAQASAIADATNPYDTLHDTLAEHPSNSGPFVAYIPTGLKATTRDLADFVPFANADVALGANLSRVREDISDADLEKIKGPGNEILGIVNNMWVVEWKALPANYIIGVAAGNAEPFLRMRIDEDWGDGLRREENDVDGNLGEIRMIRYAGFGVRDRVGAAVIRVGNGTYAIPSGYTATY